MKINIVYDASTSSAPAGFFTAVNAAVQYWEQEITNPITVTIDFGWGEVGGAPITGAGIIAESSTNGLVFSYDQIRQALVDAANSPAAVQAAASLPSTDPTGGVGLFTAVAEAEALGLPTGGATFAGAVGLNASDLFAFDPNNRAVVGKYDAVGALEHEISEVLGRIAGSGQLENGVAQYAPLDLFRFAAPGQLALTPGAASFSVDGQTLLMPFNAPSAGDPGDWDPSVTGDAFGEGQTDLAEFVSPIDLAIMQALGYTIAPTPGSTARFPDGNFVLSGMTSSAYDPARGLIYFSTIAGLIESFNPATDKTTALLNLGHFVQGLAVSPDGATLYVGLQGGTGGAETMDLVNLATLAVTAESFASGGDGPASIVITPQGEGYFTSSYDGSGWTPLSSFSTSGAFAPANVSGAPMIGAGGEAPPYYFFAPHVVLSANGHYALAYDTADSDGAVTLLDAQSGAVIASKGVVFPGNNDKADVSNAGLVVDLTYGALEVFDSQLSLVKDLSSLQRVSGEIAGVLFSQDGSELYVWDAAAKQLLLYSTSTWQQTGVIPVASSVSTLNGGASPAGDMSFADNGRLLLLNTGVGFEIIDLRPGDHRADFAGDGLSGFLLQNTSGLVAIGEVNGGQAGYVYPTALPAGWAFRGTGDFLGDGKADFLIQNASGVVAVGEVGGGQATYIFPTAIDATWKFVGTGDFLGDGKDQFMVENTQGGTAGLLAIGEIAGGHATYIYPTALPSGWSFVGTGDFLGDGKSEFMIQNASGLVAIGKLANGAPTFSFPAFLDASWKFVGDGDFLGDGRDQFMVENTTGTVAIGEIVNGHPTYIYPTGLAAEWKFVGDGDYLGEGHDQFMIESSISGAVFVGDYSGGQVHYTQVASLPPDWTFH